MLFSKQGVAVDLAKDGSMAVTCAQLTLLSYDLVLLEYMMPVMVLKTNKKYPLIFAINGYSSFKFALILVFHSNTKQSTNKNNKNNVDNDTDFENINF